MNEQHGAPPHGGLDSFFSALRRPGIVRVADGKWFAGVSTGLARWLGVDPLVVRAGFILFSLFFGMGVALYLVLWLLLPTEDGSLAIERALRHGDGGAIFLLVVTVLSLFGGGNPGWRDDWAGLRVVGFIAIGVAVWWLLTRTDHGREMASKAHWTHGGASTATTASPEVAPTPGAPATTLPRSSWAPTAGTAEPSSWQPPQPPRPPVAPRPTTPVLGFAAGAIALGAALLAGAATTWLADRADWAGNHVSIGMAVALAVVGLAALIAGLAGRRTGWIAPVAVLGIFVTLASSVSPVGLREPWRVGDRNFRPAVVEGAGPYELGMGQLRVDLSGAAVDTDPSTVQTIRASVGLGELRLVLPSGQAVRVEASSRAGGITAHPTSAEAGGTIEEGGVDYSRTLEYGTGPTQLVVEAEVGLGHINIERD